MARDGEPFFESAARLKEVLGNESLAASELRRRLGWKWGQFTYVVNKMLQDKTLFYTLVPEGCKQIKFLSLTPIKHSREVTSLDLELVDICTVQNEIISSMVNVTLHDLDGSTGLTGIGEAKMKSMKIGLLMLDHVLKICNVNEEDLGKIDATLKSIKRDAP